MSERNARKVQIGKVVSDKMDKTIVVAVETYKEHNLYHKRIRYTKKYKAHDENNQAKIGDTVKIMETRLDQVQKQLDLHLKIRKYHNEFSVLKEQIGLQTLNYGNYQRLLEAEQTLFGNGESSLFLINSRENKVLEAQQKLIELKAKFFKTAYAVQWTAGLLN